MQDKRQELLLAEQAQAVTGVVKPRGR